MCERNRPIQNILQELWQRQSTLVEACELVTDHPVSSIPMSPEMNRFCLHELQFQVTASIKNVTDELCAEREMLNLIHMIATENTCGGQPSLSST